MEIKVVVRVNGKNHHFILDEGDAPEEGMILTMVTDGKTRLSPSEHAEEAAWAKANKYLSKILGIVGK